jgi:outer membrane scaffolding protein for murein synthesis (MipA/OmpV family)
MYTQLRWHWQVSRKYTLSAAVEATRLVGDAGASPRTSQRTGIGNSLTLQYSY